MATISLSYICTLLPPVHVPFSSAMVSGVHHFHLSQPDPSSSRTRSDHMDTTKLLRLLVSTWNVGGVQPSRELDLDDWLQTKETSYDIYVLGFQEIVPLSAKNVIGPEKSSVATRWNSLIGSTLNRRNQCFHCIASKQMVGILVSVWVRDDLIQHLRHPSVSSIGCGIMGFLGNKGSVSVRFLLHKTSFCFICCHLASGGRRGDEMQRKSHAMEILSRTSFTKTCSSTSSPQKILDHDRVILLGDLNYRISLPESETRLLVQQKEWNVLLEKDQLRTEAAAGGAFEGWQEGNILFSPTYKYYPNSDEYYGCVHGKKHEKRRAPAWCDRILWYGKGVKLNRYERCEARLSDHRAVRAILTVEVESTK
ncbi:hypothetical protein HPP92_026207 [Vanilla planifolia]|uniref:Inositol polyphosphate-related phosphatase domain-containing protein n=1 Tax=Vanilla planifolia TaxID=51239 RepID=A0A835U835_VANPL|nr:hypothetical protein HPP92_026207 [Vanilla planifolia]